jgi:hypothetical protein
MARLLTTPSLWRLCSYDEECTGATRRYVSSNVGRQAGPRFPRCRAEQDAVHGGGTMQGEGHGHQILFGLPHRRWVPEPNEDGSKAWQKTDGGAMLWFWCLSANESATWSKQLCRQPYSVLHGAMHLGTWQTNDSSCTPEVQHRLLVAGNNRRAFRHWWTANVTLRLRLVLFKCLVLSSLLDFDCLQKGDSLS